MNLIAAISDLIDEPQGFIDRAENSAVAQAGLFGYFIGTMSVFTFLRMASLVPPGIFSFLCVLAVVLCVNFVFASVIHLFMELTGSGGKAMRLFFLFGVTGCFWTLLVPLGFFSKLDHLNPVMNLFICFIVVLAARISLVRRLYVIPRYKALLALGLPYVVFALGVFMVFIYSVVYLVWLLM